MKKAKKDKILIIDHCVNLVGGIERVICTIANGLTEDYDIEVLSTEKLVNKSFFHYDKRVKKTFLYDRTSGILHNSTKTGIFQRPNEILIKALIKTNRKQKIRAFLKSHENVKTIVFGRIEIALQFLPSIKKLKIPSNIIVRDAMHPLYLPAKKQKKVLKFFPDTVNTLIVSSDESKKAYTDFFNQSNINIVKIYNPLAIKPKQKWVFKNKTITAIGRLDDAQKGFDMLLPAFKIIQQKHPDWTLNIYGGGRKEGYLKNIIQKYQLKNVKIKNFTQDIVETFNQTAIFAFPSRYEGYANTLVEALACGVPSVTFNWLMGADEIIKNNENGMIIPLQNRKKYANGQENTKDVKNLADGICYLIENEDIARRFAVNAPKITKNRSKDKILNEWKKLIEN